MILSGEQRLAGSWWAGCPPHRAGRPIPPVDKITFGKRTSPLNGYRLQFHVFGADFPGGTMEQGDTAGGAKFWLSGITGIEVKDAID